MKLMIRASPQGGGTKLYWLYYEQDHRPVVAIVRSSSLMQARVFAAQIGHAEGFSDGFLRSFELDDSTAALVPKNMLNQPLALEQAETLLRLHEAQPAAKSA